MRARDSAERRAARAAKGARTSALEEEARGGPAAKPGPGAAAATAAPAPAHTVTVPSSAAPAAAAGAQQGAGASAGGAAGGAMAAAPPVAFLFPGQGAQVVGMLQARVPVLHDSITQTMVCRRMTAASLDLQAQAVLDLKSQSILQVKLEQACCACKAGTQL